MNINKAKIVTGNQLKTDENISTDCACGEDKEKDSDNE